MRMMAQVDRQNTKKHFGQNVSMLNISRIENFNELNWKLQCDIAISMTLLMSSLSNDDGSESILQLQKN